MDCDQVFMVLTSGPFPTGDASDVAVEQHLECCPSCWRIAEALRPAHDLFEEAVPASEGRELPGYWGDAIPTRTAIAQVQQTAVRTATPQRTVRPARATFYVPHAVRRAVAWGDVVCIGGLVLLVSCAALAAVWMIH